MKAAGQFSIEIQTHGGVKVTREGDGQQPTVILREVSAEEGWVWYLATYEEVAQFKKVEEQIELELRLAELHKRKRGFQGAAMRHLARKVS